MKRRFPPSKCAAALLSLLLFLSNSVFAHALETNLWQQRKIGVNLMPAISLPDPASAIQAPPTARGSSSWANLPLTLGTLRGPRPLASASDRPVVLHIQDVHLNPEAQDNIAQTLTLLAARRQLNVVGLEGAFGPMDLSAFHSYPYQDAMTAAIAQMRFQNRISGALRSLLGANTADVTVVGIDDRARYDDNVRAYQDSVSLAPAERHHLESLRGYIDGKIQRSPNPRLAEFHGAVRRYRDGKIGLSDYIASFPEQTRTTPMMTRFSQALALERTLNFNRVATERAQLLAVLTAELDMAALTELKNSAQQLNLGQIRPSDFYATLKALCRKHHCGLARYPTLSKYCDYLALVDQIDSATLFVELTAQEKATYEALAESAFERTVLAESRRLFLASKLLDFSLSKLEWFEWQTNRPPVGGFQPPANFGRFYVEAQARDQAMAANMLEAIARTPNAASAKINVLVTGGFHSTGIDRQLNEAGFNVLSFTPKITQVDSEKGSAYLSVFAQERTPLEKLFDGEKLFLSPPQENGLKAAIPVILSESQRLHPEAASSTLLRWLLPRLVHSSGAFVQRVGSWMFTFIRINDRVVLSVAKDNSATAADFSFKFPSSLGEPAPEIPEIERVKMDIEASERLLALINLTSKRPSPAIFEAVLYAFTDPDTIVRQEASNIFRQLKKSDPEKLTLLLKNLQTPLVPLGSDPRLPAGASYSPEMARLNARIASLWTIQNMVANRSKFAQTVLRPLLDNEAGSWSESDQQKYEHAAARSSASLLGTDAPDLKLIHFLLLAAKTNRPHYHWLYDMVNLIIDDCYATDGARLPWFAQSIRTGTWVTPPSLVHSNAALRQPSTLAATQYALNKYPVLNRWAVRLSGAERFSRDHQIERIAQRLVAFWYEAGASLSPLFIFNHDNRNTTGNIRWGALALRLVGHTLMLAAMSWLLMPIFTEHLNLSQIALQLLGAAASNLLIHYLFNLVFPAAALTFDAPIEWKEGMQVKHAEFGNGTVHGLPFNPESGEKFVVVIFPKKADEPDEVFSLERAQSELQPANFVGGPVARTMAPKTAPDPTEEKPAKPEQATGVLGEIRKEIKYQQFVELLRTSNADSFVRELDRTDWPFKIGDRVSSDEYGPGEITGTPRMVKGVGAYVIMVRFEDVSKIYELSEAVRLLHTSRPEVSLSENLKRLRTERRLSKIAVGRAIGLSDDSYRDRENAGYFSRRQLWRLAHFFSAHDSTLFGFVCVLLKLPALNASLKAIEKTEKLADRVAGLRELMGADITEIARALSIDFDAYKNIEKGVSPIERRKRQLLASYYATAYQLNAQRVEKILDVVSKGAALNALQKKADQDELTLPNVFLVLEDYSGYEFQTMAKAAGASRRAYQNWRHRGEIPISFKPLLTLIEHFDVTFGFTKILRFQLLMVMRAAYGIKTPTQIMDELRNNPRNFPATVKYLREKRMVTQRQIVKELNVGLYFYKRLELEDQRKFSKTPQDFVQRLVAYYSGPSHQFQADELTDILNEAWAQFTHTPLPKQLNQYRYPKAAGQRLRLTVRPDLPLSQRLLLLRRHLRLSPEDIDTLVGQRKGIWRGWEELGRPPRITYLRPAVEKLSLSTKYAVGSFYDFLLPQMPEANATTAERLRMFRLRISRTRDEMDALAGTRGSWAKWEAGLLNPTGPHLRVVARAVAQAGIYQPAVTLEFFGIPTAEEILPQLQGLSLADALKTLTRKRWLTNNQLADRNHIPRATYISWIYGAHPRRPAVRRLLQVSQYFQKNHGFDRRLTDTLLEARLQDAHDPAEDLKALLGSVALSQNIDQMNGKQALQFTRDAMDGQIADLDTGAFIAALRIQAAESLETDTPQFEDYLTVFLPAAGRDQQSLENARLIAQRLTEVPPQRPDGFGRAAAFGILLALLSPVIAEAAGTAASHMSIFDPGTLILLGVIWAMLSVMQVVSDGGKTKDKPVLLLIEDTASFRLATATGLEMAGYEVLQAETIKQAEKLETERGHDIDCVITDIGVGSDDGPSFVNEMRIRLKRDIPTIIITGRSEDEARDNGEIRPSDMILTRPIMSSAVIAAIKTAMEAAPTAVEPAPGTPAPPVAQISEWMRQYQVGLSVTLHETRQMITMIDMLIASDPQLFAMLKHKLAAFRNVPEGTPISTFMQLPNIMQAWENAVRDAKFHDRAVAETYLFAMEKRATLWFSQYINLCMSIAESLKSLSDPIATSVERLTGLIDELIQGHIISKGEFDTAGKPQLTNINNGIHQTLTYLRHRFSPRLNLEFYEGTGILPVTIDPRLLASVLQNPVKNSAEAAADEGMTNVRFSFTTRRIGNEIEIIMQDEGPGIHPKTLEMLNMKPAEREQAFGVSAVTTKADGHGIGVDLLREIIERAGGSFRMESTTLAIKDNLADKPLNGTKTIIRLPISEEALAMERVKFEPAVNRDVTETLAQQITLAAVEISAAIPVDPGSIAQIFNRHLWRVLARAGITKDIATLVDVETLTASVREQIGSAIMNNQIDLSTALSMAENTARWIGTPAITSRAKWILMARRNDVAGIKTLIGGRTDAVLLVDEQDQEFFNIWARANQFPNRIVPARGLYTHDGNLLSNQKVSLPGLENSLGTLGLDFTSDALLILPDNLNFDQTGLDFNSEVLRTIRFVRWADLISQAVELRVLSLYSTLAIARAIARNA